MRHLTIFVLVVCVAFSVSACGKKSKPEAPGQSSYPNTYPAPVE